jgi:hypothetical protein
MAKIVTATFKYLPEGKKTRSNLVEISFKRTILIFHAFSQDNSKKNVAKVEIFLEQREVAFLSPSKICENLNFSTDTVLMFLE